MKKVKVMLILTAFIGLLSCGGNSADDLKKNEKLLKETMQKCSTGKLKSNDKNCVNVKKVQTEMAKEVWDKKKAEIEAKVKENEKYIENGQYEHMFDLFPKKVAEHVGKANGVTAKEFVEEISKYAPEEYGDGKLILRRDFSKAKVNQTFVGRTYAVVPLSSQFKTSDGKSEEGKSETLIFQDEGKWYMINIDKISIPVLKEVYPDLKELEELK